MNIAVVTPSLPTRSQELCRAIQSVNQQSLPPDVHLIAVDYAHVGPAVLRNRMIEQTDAEWIAFLDDDDRLDSHHLSTLAAYVDRADVIIPHCRFDGRPIPRSHYNVPYRRERLRQHGIFPITVLARRDFIVKVGMFNPDDRYEDWVMFNKMADAGARFLVVPKVTWTYTRLEPSRTDLPR